MMHDRDKMGPGSGEGTWLGVGGSTTAQLNLAETTGPLETT